MSYFHNQRRFLKMAILGCGVLCLTAAIFAQESRIDEGTGIEVLARGPVHEAFAEPIVFDAKPGAIVSKAPPEPIEELPPDQKPAGGNVVWIPGYWNWDEEREDFLWVSGFWRTLPPGREWVPGYWAEMASGWQWVSGYWANAQDDGTEYLPEPPQTLETDPSTEPPSPNHVWVPGTWYWREARYVWRPGYWIESQPNWMWCPAHYVWTPRGFIFVGGYWDYMLPRRGMLFAPVYFTDPFYRRPGYFYTPSMVVNLTILTDHFFVGVDQRHYYFGDYYAANLGDGMYPWFAFSSSRFGWDPIYAHYHSQHGRRDRDWANRVRSDYERRRDDENARPERIAAIGSRTRRPDGQRADGERSLVQPLAQLVSAPDTRGTLETLPKSRRTELAKVAQQTRDFTSERMKTETDPNAKSRLTAQPEAQSNTAESQPDQKTKPKTDVEKRARSSIVKRSKSPIVDVPIADAATKKDSGPATPKTSPPGLKVQPNASGKEPPAVPKVSPKTEPRLPIPDKPAVPKTETKPPVKTPPAPKVEPPKGPPATPKVEPPPKVRPEVPKAEPPPKVRPEIPRVEPPPKVRPEIPKVEPPPKIRPEVPRAEPKPPRPSPPAGDKPSQPKPRPPKPEKEPKK